jgi:hypothetical protein
MRTFGRSVFLHCSKAASVTSRTAVYGPVCTVVWQGSAGDCRPYADQTGFSATSIRHRLNLPKNGAGCNGMLSLSAALCCHWRHGDSSRRNRQ